MGARGALDSGTVDPVWTGTAALAGALGGLAVPWLLRRLPDPAPEVPWAPDPEHAILAARRGLPLRCALAGLVSGGVLGVFLPAPWPLLLWLTLVPFGILLAVVDWHTKKLPRRVVLPMTAYALVVIAVVELAAGDSGTLVRAVVGMLVARSVIWLLWFIRSAGMGFGDVRLTALLGLLLAQVGVGEAVVGLYSAFLLFGIPGVLLAIVRRDRQVLRTAYPFGPFLLAGALVGVAVGAPAWRGLMGG